MKVRAHRIRRAAAAATLAAGMVAGAVGATAGVARAASTPTYAEISAASHPTMTSTGSGQAAGNLSILVPRNTTGSTFTVDVVLTLDSNGTVTGHVTWTTATLSGTGFGGHQPTFLTAPTRHESAVEITLTQPPSSGVLPGQAAGTIDVTGIRYDTSGAIGTLEVVPSRGASGYRFGSVEGASNATLPGSSRSAVVVSATATAKPELSVDAGGQTAGTWRVRLTATAGDVGWARTSSIVFRVEPGGATDTNCAPTTGEVLFTGTPTAVVTASAHASVTPTFTLTKESTYATCRSTQFDVLRLAFTNAGTFSEAGHVTITISGIKYDVRPGTDPQLLTGTLSVLAATTAFTSDLGPAAASNGTVSLLYLKADTPPASFPKTTAGGAISPIDVVEQEAGELASGTYVCLSLAQTVAGVSRPFADRFDVSTAGSVKVTRGDGTVAPTLAWQTTTGTAVTSGTASFVRFQVATASAATEPSTYSLTGLTVAVADHTGPVTVEASQGTADCASQSDPGSVGTATAFSVTPSSQRIAGATADATAVKLLETSYEATTGGARAGDGTTAPTGCVGLHTNDSDTRPVVLATTADYQDALSSQYLAEYLDTGVLLTPTSKLSSVTQAALRTEGVTQVDVVGGDLAISTAVVAQLKATPAYSCGGAGTLETSSGGVRTITVTRIAGDTAAETAAAVDERVPESHDGTVSLAGAYAGTDPTGGMGRYNDTSGAASPAASTSVAVPTAIVASDAEYQDAMAASALSYDEALPIVLTTATTLAAAAKGTVATLGIKQAIVMGGPLAVTNAVVTSLEGLGVEVLRVAGHTYTDTAVQLAQLESNTTEGGLGLGWAGTKMAVARGNGFTDGLVGAVVAGKVPEPVLLTESPTAVGQYLTAFLKDQAKTGIDGQGATRRVRALTVCGGTLAVSPAVYSQMEADIDS